MKSENNQQVTLYLRHGSSPDQTVASFCAEHGARFQRFWLEPVIQFARDGQQRPRPGRLPEFTPYTKSPPDKLPELAQAYLFGEHRGLHAVASGSGCRWFEFNRQPPLSEQSWEKKTVRVIDSKILRRGDFQRFGAAKLAWVDNLPEQFEITEYWSDSGLLAWNLGEKNEVQQ